MPLASIDKIELFANYGIRGASAAVTDSPLVEEDTGSAVFVGGAYIFGSTKKPEPYVTPGRESEWTWRVNYGYQAEGNVVGEIDQGDFSTSSFADTRIAGATLSKLIANGPRVEFYGRVAAFRHFEEDEGNGNFGSYAAYVMAMGKGSAPGAGRRCFAGASVSECPTRTRYPLPSSESRRRRATTLRIS